MVQSSSSWSRHHSRRHPAPLLFLIPQYGAALVAAVTVIAFELLVLKWLCWRVFETRFLYSFASVAFGGAIIAGLSAALGSAG